MKKMRNSKGEYNFYFLFTSGGNNSVWAKNKKEAFEKAVNEFYPAYPVYSSFKKMDQKFCDEIDRYNYLATN